ncbi:hypothetical protein CRM22_000467 [Opisthorchis felineus]|uniref:Origin recognition complex subunit 1 n=1 Tax=Opisthorchis felineus TaxID=147828 RepID=A0A4S2MEW6_OPIFE|nr:hypothetical protein CRM22_000467 [Opisthorchis felineus]
MPTERLSARSGSTRLTTFSTVQLGIANTSGVVGVQHNPTIPTSNDTPLPRTSRRACKDLALARLLSTVDLDDGRERSQKRSSTMAVSTKRPVRSALTSCSLESPIRRLHTFSILRSEGLQKKTASNWPTSGYRRSRVAVSKSDVDEDSHHKLESSNESVSSDDTSETATSEESSPSDSSESDFFEDWNKRRPIRRPRKCQPKTPKRPPPRTEACSAMRVAKPPNSLLPKRTFSVPARKHTGIMTSANPVVVGESLPGREQEFDSIYTFISGKLLQGTGGCMYISGLPGTGKTASVNAVLAAMTDVRDQRATFQKITVNGMQVNDPKQVYAQILQQLTGQLLPAKQAAQQLEREFCSSGLSQSHREKGNLPPVVLVIDELDLLCTRRQDVLYNLFDWPTRPRGRRSLIVLAIANTMDLPERLLHPRVASRLGLTRLTFAPYSHEQLVHIVQSRLIGTGSSAFQDKSHSVATKPKPFDSHRFIA